MANKNSGPVFDHGIPGWDEYFIRIARLVATRSKDPNTKMGAVIVGPGREILSTGYNSFPRGADDNRTDRLERPEKYNWMVHAEANAICNAARTGQKLKGSSLYLLGLPCVNCSLMIVQVGISNLYVDINFHNLSLGKSPKYASQFNKAREILACNEEEPVELTILNVPIEEV